MATKKLKCGRSLPDNRQRRKKAKSADWKKLFRSYAETEGLKHSDQRLAIAEIAMSLEGHFNIQDVVRRAQEKHATIGAATVYRSVALLHNAGLLKETFVDEVGSTIYEVACDDHHDHIVCLDCGHIVEFRDEKIEKLQAGVSDKLKFSEVRHRHVIYAHCRYLEKR